MLRSAFLIVLSLLYARTLYAQDDAYLPESSLPLEIVETAGYVLAYSERHEQAAWVAYELTLAEVRSSLERTNDFRADQRISTGSAILDDYRGSGYDRGHLAPAADMRWSREAMSQSFLLSNISPQLPGFNRGIWKRMEEQIRTWAARQGRIYVITGPVFPASPTESIGGNQVTIPVAYWKVLLDPAAMEMYAFLIEHTPASGKLHNYAATVDQVEGRTGLDFFASLPDSIEDLLESRWSREHWPLSQRVNSGGDTDEPIEEAPTSGLIDINTASQAELESLPGIGPVLAGRIIEGRPWGRVEDLIEVQGIGTKRLEAIRDLIRTR